MATICAGRCKLAEIPSNPTGLFTFGSPRVGTTRYINYVRIPHYRWVNNNDIVARVLQPGWAIATEVASCTLMPSGDCASTRRAKAARQLVWFHHVASQVEI